MKLKKKNETKFQHIAFAHQYKNTTFKESENEDGWGVRQKPNINDWALTHRQRHMFMLYVNNATLIGASSCN